MGGYILTSFEDYFNCKYPEKFYDNLKKASESKGQTVEDSLIYYFHRHYVGYLYHVEMKVVRGLILDNEPDIIEKAEVMNEWFRKWLPEVTCKEIIESANNIYKQILENEHRDTEEE